MIESTRLPDDVAAALRAATPADRDLIALLHENAPVYQGKASSEVERLRALIMVGLVKAGFAGELLPYAIEEFESGTDAYAIAAAARVVRAAPNLPSDIGLLINRAAERVRRRNQFVSFEDGAPAPGHPPVTAVDEVMAALSALDLCSRAAPGSVEENPASDLHRPVPVHAACCHAGRTSEAVERSPEPIVGTVAGLGDIEMQDQDGRRALFGDLFAKRAGLAAFFYTRCMNPEKCSRTVSQLAEVARLIRGTKADGSVMIAGITYDPAYDLPERLRRYGGERGLAFADDCQLLRTTGCFDALRDRLQLGVGYGTSTVNRHRIELILIDHSGDIVQAHVRRLWDAQEIADQLLSMHDDAKHRAQTRTF
ncbi:SCO family protein [Bradyrhizobium liaoningense]|uniref:SCO family protein n=1 Tax=Bradyrhizobium liaoningense TaxID=43992 RepID=UPI001BA71175|nr:SCO family protein [Bradyrhizobium liaoningense]MBR0901354.1 SCO family protein [Bradyrhizobium liaoningense]